MISRSKKWAGRATALTAMTATVGLSFTGLAYADDISNNLDATVDAVAEVMPLNVGGPNGSTNLYVIPANGDGKNGCNLTGSTALGLSVASSNTAVATVSPSSVTFTSCSDTKTLTVTPVAAGSATVSATQTSNSTDGTFNLAPATFTVNVAPPANTAPAVTVAGVTGGASYNKGSVPAATCQVTDAEDGSSSFAATLSAVTGPYASDGIGSQTASCSYTDGGGLTASASETYSIVDPSAPVISYTLTPAAPTGANGWYTGNVNLDWTVTEPQSPNSLQTTGCDDQNITADQAATTYSCSATSAGGSAAEQSVTIKRDGTAPVVSYDGVVSGPANGNGWYRTDVTVNFTATDATSGVSPASQQATTSGEGNAVTVGSPPFTDNAGNTADAVTSPAFKIDKTNPSTPTFNGGPTGDYYFGSDPAAPTCDSSDSLSGLDTCVVTGGGSTVGPHSYTATATDNAGNTSTATLHYTVLAWTANGFYAPVDMGGVLNTVKGGSTVPLKFELFAGSTELTSTSAVKSFTTTKVNCTTGAGVEDAIEVVTTGGTSLRYDTTGGQFIQNWKTPTGAGSCYKATMTSQDGSSISALFKTK